MSTRSSSLISHIIRNEGAFDPFMLRHHVFTEDQEAEWYDRVMTAFTTFVNGMPEEEFNVLQQRLYEKYPANVKNAKEQMAIAVAHEDDMRFDAAQIAYMKAFVAFEKDHDTENACKCLMKLAYYNIQDEKYDQAISNYNHAIKINSECVNGCVPKCLFYKALCHLAKSDVEGAEKILSKEMTPSHYHVTLLDMLDDVKRYDADGFTRDINEFEKTTNTALEPWLVSLLLKIKNNIKK